MLKAMVYIIHVLVIIIIGSVLYEWVTNPHLTEMQVFLGNIDKYVASIAMVLIAEVLRNKTGNRRGDHER